MRLLGWLASIIAVLAAIFLPALTAEAPLVPKREWTISQLAGEGLRAATRPQEPERASLRQVIQQAEQVQRELGGGAASPQLKRAAALALLVPVAAIVAGLCAILSLLWMGLRWRWVYRLGAVVGLLACLYAVVASWMLTRAAQAELARMLARLQHGFSGLLHGLGMKMSTQLHATVGVGPDVGLYVLGLLFLAMLLVPLSGARV